MERPEIRGKKKEEYVHSVFENIAHKYDFMNNLLSFRFHKLWRNKTMEKMNVRVGDNALDVCCGTADWTIDLANHSKTGKVIGLDFSKNMLNVGEKKVKSLNLDKQIVLQYGNAMDLPYEDNTFDHATIGFALRNVPDIEKVLSEMTRVVKPGGKVVSLELSKPNWKPFRMLYFFYFYKILPFLGKLFADRYEQYSWLPESLTNFPDQQELAKIFEKVGLENIEVYPLTGGIAAIHIGYKKKGK
ncbi:bifunctional demethylmenaquinone methyltransferase/2-methoxy-6-polyprenyl-1,4-benzoquinol methylase [Vulcanibacillus modesticaldus]|uniref:Demethylmenaquinone methyltransferase n=1 Tax=Vulcanibacillus modesticaldus TaxID=337097 RepID=A0A1D2YSJ2_9BACI|nr:demethylmenaquinone methyltransferase [Vulcanibacillus modesticaldus]OEF97294.1 bifunctional demethylmenaquinone methyltransferase/2-methoxy-6-polyprenyl-1,4-benzoquinol methylase [Vulcanibacillus modesticaldus]